ncbi:uncharacterized protein LOC119160108 isoform X2 [Rhipicephalus microplus]|uniref:uncharacterized protein LOC119160108 isoform X2 n=1 Tax=Rhipicephalus microplus TaxID=6941 RepID=UPI003F6C6804
MPRRGTRARWMGVLVLVLCGCGQASQPTTPAKSPPSAAMPSAMSPAPTAKAKTVMYYDGKTIARVEYGADGVTLQTCRLFELDDEREAEPIIKAQGLPVQQVEFPTMLSLISKCRDLHDWSASTNSTPQWSASSIWSGIIPAMHQLGPQKRCFAVSARHPSSGAMRAVANAGTKWCGLGDIASSYEDLGSQVTVDVCCRAHDHCPVKLKAFRTGYDLVNFSLYTKSHCDCDRDFYNCLRRAKNHIADAIGNVYFNVIKVPCIRKVRKPVCTDRGRRFSRSESSCETWAYQELGMQFVPTEHHYP